MYSSEKQTYREIILLFSVIFLVVLLLVLGGRLLFGKKAEVVTEAISVRIEDLPREFFEDIHLGERVLDRSRRTILGTIEEISSEPHFYERAVNGESLSVEKKGYCDVTLRIRIERDNRRNRESGIFYIGASLILSTPSFAGEGRIVSVHSGSVQK